MRSNVFLKLKPINISFLKIACFSFNETTRYTWEIYKILSDVTSENIYLLSFQSFDVKWSPHWVSLTVFRMDEGEDGGGEAGGKKVFPTSFSLLTSTNVGVNLQNFLALSFNPFAKFQGHA